MAFSILVFAFVFLIVAGCGGFAAAYLRTQENARLRTMLRTADLRQQQIKVSFLRPTPTEGQLQYLIYSSRVAIRIRAILLQAGLTWSFGKWATMTIGLAAAGLFAGMKAPQPFTLAFALGLPPALGWLPTSYILRRRTRRLDEFIEQFPEALDFLARSLRAGHALSVGLELLGAESPEPLGSTLRLVSNDLRLGSSHKEAFARLNQLVPILDVQFFTAAVLLQQETGGNLSEIFAKLSHIIRDRFRLRGQVRAISAHGRITAGVLIAMPFAVAVMMFLISPAYLMVLFNTKQGQTLLIGALAAQAVGIVVVNKIIAIKV